MGRMSASKLIGRADAALSWCRGRLRAYRGRDREREAERGRENDPAGKVMMAHAPGPMRRAYRTTSPGSRAKAGAERGIRARRRRARRAMRRVPEAALEPRNEQALRSSRVVVPARKSAANYGASHSSA